MERESRTLEYKEKVTRTFLKTVSAYANYGEGRVVFGVDGAGTVVGVDDPAGEALRIENMIDDSLDPVPRYSMILDDASRTIILTVSEGEDKPYLCGGKAYRRMDASTREVDRTELRRLALLGQNVSMDALKSRRQDLELGVLEERLREAVGIQKLDSDVLRTLGLVGSDGAYTNAAALLADENQFPGVDVVRFGDTINELMDRQTVEGKSLLLQLDAAMQMYERYYVAEVVRGVRRERVEAIPREAFREAVANALAHRVWDVNADVTIAMHPDRIEVTSPGTLPMGLSLEDYLRGGVSAPRNPLVATVFFRLGIIERFGTGIRRIRSLYEGRLRQPLFGVAEGSVHVTLPTEGGAIEMSPDSEQVLDVLGRSFSLPRQDIEQKTGFKKGKTVRLLGELERDGLVVRSGQGRSSRYRIA